MELYGDESGHLRSLLQGEGDIFILGVVAGEPENCIACPKRAVRQVKNIEEARWNDLTDTQRRRLIDCLTECESELSFGYVALERSDLLNFEKHYRLYKDDLQYDWDICVIGDCYAELAQELASGTSRVTFNFDRLFSKKVSNKIVDVVLQTTPDLNVEHKNSRQVKGIQAADCFAGAVREHLLEDQKWLNEFDEVTCATDFALAGIEQRLHDEKTAP